MIGTPFNFFFYLDQRTSSPYKVLPIFFSTMCNNKIDGPLWDNEYLVGRHHQFSLGKLMLSPHLIFVARTTFLGVALTCYMILGFRTGDSE